MEEIIDTQSRVLGDILSQLGFVRSIYEGDLRYQYTADPSTGISPELYMNIYWQDNNGNDARIEPYTVVGSYTLMHAMGYMEKHNISYDKFREIFKPPYPMLVDRTIEDAITYFKQFLG